jgi:hypothetical protein
MAVYENNDRSESEIDRSLLQEFLGNLPQSEFDHINRFWTRVRARNYGGSSPVALIFDFVNWVDRNHSLGGNKNRFRSEMLRRYAFRRRAELPPRVAGRSFSEHHAASSSLETSRLADFIFGYRGQPLVLGRNSCPDIVLNPADGEVLLEHHELKGLEQWTRMSDSLVSCQRLDEFDLMERRERSFSHPVEKIAWYVAFHSEPQFLNASLPEQALVRLVRWPRAVGTVLEPGLVAFVSRLMRPVRLDEAAESCAVDFGSAQRVALACLTVNCLAVLDAAPDNRESLRRKPGQITKSDGDHAQLVKAVSSLRARLGLA